jgi:hypothetical protein
MNKQAILSSGGHKITPWDKGLQRYNPAGLQSAVLTIIGEQGSGFKSVCGRGNSGDSADENWLSLSANGRKPVQRSPRLLFSADW